MSESKRLTLIIDANNLAHYLDHLAPGQSLSAEEIFRLAVHLANYARNAQPPITIELCFDPLPPATQTPLLPWVHCMIAPARSTADDLLRQRFRFYQHHGDRCIVITNDGEILDDVEEEGGECLLVYDFVRRAGKSPVFRQPGEFKAARARRTAPQPRKMEELDWSWLNVPAQEINRGTLKREECPSAPAEAAVDQPDELLPIAPDVVTEPTVQAPDPSLPSYRLALENWPLEIGLHFLLDSFCPAHRRDEEWLLYQSLAAGEIRPDDLSDLAALLRTRCGGEPGFAQQGALMKRVRLALIQTVDQRLSLPELAQVTGLNAHGLQGRIREKAAPWVEIIRSQ